MAAAMKRALILLALSALASIANGQSFDPLTPPGNVCPGSSTEYPPPGNLVANGFDNGVPANWFCPFCVSGLVIESDATSTYAAANAANRNGVEDAGVGVSVYNLVPGQSHLFYAWVRVTGAVAQKNYGVIVRGSALLIEGTFEGGPFCLAPVAQIQNDCWTLVKGAFTPTNTADLFRISVEDRGANVHVRGIAIIPTDPAALRAQQNAQIDALRKANIQLSFQRNGSPVSGSVDFVQVRSGFAWGIQDVDYGVTYDQQQADFVGGTFRSSVVSQANAGWPATESGPGQTDYSFPTNFIAWAESYGFPVFGPQTVWDDVNDGIPKWVQSEVANAKATGGDPAGLLDYYIRVRSENAMRVGAGKYVTVTVDNEGIHKNYIPSQGGGFDSVVRTFLAARQADNALGYNTPITFNEYNVAEGCYYNFPLDAYGDPVSPEVFAERVNTINGLGAGQLINIAGLQLQVTPNQREDQRMGIAITKVAESTGLPVHITELNVNVGNSYVGNYGFDRNLQADILESVLRQTFSNPYVEAILFQHVTPYPYGGDSDATCGPCLFSSQASGFQPNAAGERYLALRDEWSTKLTGLPVSGSAALRVFHGDYAVTFTDSSGNVSPTQYVRIYDDNQSGQTQFVTVNV